MFGLLSIGPYCSLPLNGDPLPFESEIFQGCIGVFVRHLASTPTALFKGRKRLMWVVLQVRVCVRMCVCVCDAATLMIAAAAADKPTGKNAHQH